MLRSLTRAAAAAPLLALPLTAQARVDSLAPVVTTATRVDARLRVLPFSATVITGDELRATGITHVLDALRASPSAALVQTASFGSQTSLFLRGGESDYVRVLVDGVPYNGPGGAVDLGQLTTDAVERIEIVRGPASVLYGSDAVAGVVQVFTRRGRGAPAVQARAAAGAFGTAQGSVAAHGDGWAFEAARQRTDGIYAFNNAYTNTVVAASLGGGGPRGDARVGVRYGDWRYGTPTNSAGVVGDRDAFTTERRLIVSADASVALRDRLRAQLSLVSSEARPRFDDGPDDAADTLGFFAARTAATVTRRGADLRLTWLPRGQAVTAGVAYLQDDERSTSVYDSQFGPSEGAFTAGRVTRAVYAQALGDLGARLSYTGGVRVDDNSAFGTFTTGRAGVGLVLGGGLSARAAAGIGFKEPTFFENFAQGFVRGNPALTPERSRSAEAGLAWRGRRGGIEATGFVQQFRDLIQYAPTPFGSPEPNYRNLAAADADGIELAATWLATSRLVLRGTYTRLATEVVDAGADDGAGATFVAGARLLRRPDDAGSVTAAVTLPRGLVATVAAQVVGSRDDRDFADFPATPVVLDGYTRVDATLTAPLRGWLWRDGELQVRVDNVAGATYEQVFGFRAPGRVVAVGVRVTR
jgi:vitamin B12 transporter